MLNQKILTLNASLKEAKDNLTLETEKNKNNLEQLTENYNKERLDYQNKIDNISNDLNIKERELASFKFL